MSEDAITRRRFLKVGAAAVGTVAIGGGVATAATWAPDADKPSMKMGDGAMKALVVYGTKTGCTAGIAEQIGNTLSEAGMTVDVIAAENAQNPSGYDAVVVGSGVRAGTWHEPVRTWVEGNAEQLKAIPVAFYTCGLTTAQDPEKVDEVRAYASPLIEGTGITPVDVGVFAGWFEPEKFSFVERTILKMMKAPKGDHRDMDAVASWTSSIVAQLGA